MYEYKGGVVMCSKNTVLVQIEKLRAFLTEASVYYLLIMMLFGASFCLFVLCPLLFFLHGLPAQFLEYLMVGGIWFFLLVTFVAHFLVALLTTIKMFITGFTREEARFFAYTVLLALGYAIFFVVFTNRLFTPR
jgi:hypothetical protein